MKSINIEEKLGLFSEHWSHKIIANVDDYDVKLVKFEGEFVFHTHDDADELFMVMEGEFVIAFRAEGKPDWEETVRKGEIIVVPAGVEHKPIAEREVSVLMFEKKTVDNTGGVEDERQHRPVRL